MTRRTEMSRVHTTQNPTEGEFLLGILRQEGIEAHFETLHDTALDGLFQTQWGYGHIVCATKDAYKALAIIEAVLKTIDREAELSKDDPSD